MRRSILLPSIRRWSERHSVHIRRGIFMSAQRARTRAWPFRPRRRGSTMLQLLSSIVFLVATGLRPTTAEPNKQTDDTVDSEHLFGFTQGSDIGERGEKELETDSTGRFGRQGGTYAVRSTALEAKYTPLDYFRVAGS